MWPDAVRAKQTDVVVVGAGAAGMAVARVLIEAGLDVTVVEADGRIGRDVSAVSIVPRGGEWDDLADMVIGPWSMGKAFDRFSTADWWNGEDGEDGGDGYCREGYGALWAHSARGNTGEALDPGDEDILGRAQLRKPVGERVWFAGEA